MENFKKFTTKVVAKEDANAVVVSNNEAIKMVAKLQKELDRANAKIEKFIAPKAPAKKSK